LSPFSHESNTTPSEYKLIFADLEKNIAKNMLRSMEPAEKLVWMRVISTCVRANTNSTFVIVFSKNEMKYALIFAR
jgi:hypothetical protein